MEKGEKMKLFRTVIIFIAFALMATSLTFADSTGESISVISDNDEYTSIVDQEIGELAINGEYQLANVRGGGFILIKLYRYSPSSTTVQVYVKYLGTGHINRITFSDITFRNTSTNGLLYSTGYVPKTFPSSIGFNQQAFVTTVSIPTSYSTVRVNASGITVYVLESGWISATNFSGNVTIQ